MKRFTMLLLLLCVANIADAQVLTWKRDGVKVTDFFSTANTPEANATRIREVVTLIGADLDKRDTLVCRGVADFGKQYVLTMPNCYYVGEGAEWLHHMTIDAEPTKPYSTPGFVLGTFQHFKNMKFGGDCWNVEEDGGLLGWGVPLDNTDPKWVGVSGPGDVTFESCVIDASKGMDWAIYSWSSQYKRTITLTNCVLKYCRFGVSFAGSGDAANQITVVSGCQCYGDANGSHSYGETSNNNPETGGALSAVLMRGGYATIQNSRFEAIGLTAEYSAPKWGCPRLASICTNQYYSAPGSTFFILDNCTSKITPNIAYVWNDIDIRGTAATTTITNKLGSNPDGSLKIYTP